MAENKHHALTLTVAHINDTHSYFQPTSLQLSVREKPIQTEPSLQDKQCSLIPTHLNPYVSAGGFARISTRAQQLKAQAEKQGEGFLFLHAGDCFQGSLFFSLFKGEANADLLNALEIDTMVLGNHELDMGNDPVAQFVKRIQFPLLAGNWDLSNEDENKPLRLSTAANVKSYDLQTRSAQWITKSFGSEEVAIFGLSIDKMSSIANPDPDTPFIDAITTARITIAAIQQSGINKIILLSHLGYEADLALAEKVEGLSLIVGGHSHRLQGDFSDIGLSKDDEYGVKIHDTYVVQAGCHAMHLGHCTIEFNENGQVTRFSGQNELLIGRRLFVDASRREEISENARPWVCEQLESTQNVRVCRKDPKVQGILENKYLPKVSELQNQVVAYTARPLRHVRVPDEQGPSELAPLVAQSFHYALNKAGHKVDFAIHNAGGVRNSLEAGEVSVADIAGKLLSFAVPIGCYRVTGRVIQQMLEGAINNATNNGVEGTGTGSYPYVYNLRYRYIATAPVGERVSELAIYQEGLGWQPIEIEKIYSGSSSAYTMKGKEGYHAVLQSHGENMISHFSMSDCLLEMLTDHPESLSSPKILEYA